ncbi:DNA-directed RNA polymerase I subunit RPA34.5-domain-containing protein [Pseudomassariella vexata]|uniref:DNA-directed RNA polymerase I subunit RPA34.5-domain-containing protein n=1 Tax=Pseudomassariella vexata TaxID=1141098 RepID=A0A1Y2DIA8_9PEZI|nr:DNA-directed RNA polymerase I subunit RPA34.5-domain-containing protein [Pseudomassariella vexata]ORY58886.1 DNA-directed RNA polymerase I subunit RPA34.5-domain-containing protein [Pseudomassariella vexata]
MAPKSSIGSLAAMKKNINEKKSTPAIKSSSIRARELPASSKSSEFVEDSSSSSGSDGSDSDDGIEAARKKLEAKKATALKPKVNGIKAVPATATEVQTAKKPPKADSESDSESDTTSSGSDSESEKKPAPKTDAKKSSTNTSDSGSTSSESGSESGSGSDSESDSDNEEESGAKAQSVAKTQTPAKPTTTKPAAQAAKSTEDSDSSSEDSDDENEVDPKAIASINGASGAKQAGQVAQPAWLENSEFMIRKASSDNPGKEVADFFSKANLEGKQVWYFTAPASLPITVLRDMEIDMAKAAAGGTIIKHQGDSYGLDLEPYATNNQVQILMANKKGDKWSTPVSHGVDSTVHIRREAKFGGESTVSATATDDYVRRPKPIREQPEGLRARFTPIGVPNPKPVPFTRPAVKASAIASLRTKPAAESSSESDSDEEMTTTAALPFQPKPVANDNLKRKQPVDESGSDDDDTSSSDSDEAETLPPPAKETKPAGQPAKRAKMLDSKLSADMAKTTFATPQIPSSQASKITNRSNTKDSTPTSKKAKKHEPPSKVTPVPPPRIGIPGK